MSIFSSLMRLFFRLLYHTFAWIYDAVAAIVSLRKWQSWVLAVVPYLTGPRILELGHGPGHLQARLLSDDRLAFGLDESYQMGRISYKRLKHKRLIPSLVRGVAQALPYPTGIFQQVVATFPSEYILDPETLTEIYRVLVPGGEAVLLLIAWITEKRWYGRLAAWLFRITGQAPAEWDDRNLGIFQEIGFQCRAENVSLNASKLLMIHLIKPANE